MKNLQKTILASSLLLAFGVSTANAADAPIRQLGEVTVDGEKVEISDIIGGYTIGSSESQTVTIANKGFTEYTDSKGEQVQTANRGIWVTGEDKSKVLGSEITISSENGRGIQADSKGTLSIGGDNTKSVTVNSNSIGIFVLTGAQVDIKTQTLTVNEKSESGFGIHVQNNTQTAQAPENSSYLKIEADNIVVNSTALGLSAFSNGQMDINGNIVVNAEHAIDTRGNATINVNTDGKHTTVLNGDIVFETPYTKEDPKGSGNLINSNINVGLHGEGSSWTGRAYQNFIGEDKTDVDTVDLDNEDSARHMAQAVGIDVVRSQMLPQDKLKAIEELQKEGPIAMVGDGINDAPALARANIGFAMGRQGSDIAIDAADVALMDDDIGKLPTFIKLSRLTHNRLVQNITFALGIKAIFMILTFLGMATMWMAVFADIGTCLIVVAWGLSLLRVSSKLAKE